MPPLSTTVSPSTTRAPFTERRYVLTFIFVVSLFMLWGLGVTMADVLNKHVQQVLHVSKANSAYVQAANIGQPWNADAAKGPTRPTCRRPPSGLILSWACRLAGL
jgi:hypothetical protein